MKHDHERSDVPVRTIWMFLAGLAIGGVLVTVVLGGLWRLFSAMEEEPSVSAWIGPRELPAGPRLQVAPVIDLLEYQRRQTTILNSYGWLDRQSGTVHIPIDRAMQMLLERGVPTRAQRAPRKQDSLDTRSTARESNEPKSR